MCMWYCVQQAHNYRPQSINSLLEFLATAVVLYCHLLVRMYWFTTCLLTRDWVPPERFEGRNFEQHRRRGIVAGHLPPRALHAGGKHDGR